MFPFIHRNILFWCVRPEYSIIFEYGFGTATTIWTFPTPGHLPAWAAFHERFSIVIHIRRKFHSAHIRVVVKWSLRNFAHGTTTALSYHMQNYVAIRHPTFAIRWNKFPIEFESRWKIDREMDLLWRFGGIWWALLPLFHAKLMCFTNVFLLSTNGQIYCTVYTLTIAVLG